MRFKVLFLMLTMVLSLAISAFSQEVRVVYFFPNDREVPNTNTIDEQLDILMQRVQKLFESKVEKTLNIEKYANGKTQVHYFAGKNISDNYRDKDGINGQTVRDEIKNSDGKLGQEMSSYLYLIAADLVPDANNLDRSVCGQADYLFEPPGWHFWDKSTGPWAVIDVSSHCFYSIEEENLDEAAWGRRVWITAHELGHAFGLGHDFRDSSNIMSYGGCVDKHNNVTNVLQYPNQLSPAAIEWLKASRFFNNAFIIDPDQPTEIELASPPVYLQDIDDLHLKFQIRDADGLHQAQLHVRPKNTPQGYLTECYPVPSNPTRDMRWQKQSNKLVLFNHQTLKWPEETIEFIYTKINEEPLHNPKVQLRVIDLRGNITEKEFTLNPDEIVRENASDTDSRIEEHTEPTSDASPSSDVNNFSQESRLRATLRGHTDFVTSVAFSPHGRTLATGSWDDTIRLWNPRTAEHLKTLTGHEHDVTSVAFHPTGEQLATGSWDTKIGVWDLTAEATDPEFYDGHGGFVTSVAYLPISGEKLAWGSEDNHVRITSMGDKFPNWSSYENGHIHYTTGSYFIRNVRESRNHGHDVSSVTFSPDERTLASGSWDNTVKLWTNDPHLETTLSGHEDFVTSVAFTPNGKILASGSWDNTIRLWDMDTDETLLILNGHTDRVLAVAFSADGRTLASGSDDQTIRLWDVATGQQKDILLGHTSGVTAVAFSPDRRMLASTGGWDNTVRLWDLSPARTPAPTVRIAPSPVISPTVGKELVIKVDIAGVQDVAGYQATVHFDPSALRYVESANGTYLPSGSLFVPPVVSANQVTLAATSLSGDSDGAGTLATLTFEVVAVKPSQITLSDVMIMKQDLTSIPIIVKAGDVVVSSEEALDVNGDGIVDILDLTLVATHFGKFGDNQADVNGDSIVDIRDLLLVAGGINADAAAPSTYSMVISTLTVEEIQMWLSQAQQLDLSEATYQRGFAVLQQLLIAVTPKETALLPNYPNPFNPETWIPYQLAKPTDVTISIYTADGRLVRTLALGYQPVGMYESRSRAAYWDGRNAQGEPVASGVYFYTLTAGEFSATRKMSITK